MKIPQEEQYKPDELFLPDRVLADFAATVETPFFVYDERGIRDRAQLLRSACGWSAGCREFFPVKAAPIPAILRILREEGCGAFCTTQTELHIAAYAGFTGQELLFYAGNPLPEDARLAAQLGAGLVLDRPEQMGFYLRHGGLREELGMRLRVSTPLRVGGMCVAQPADSLFGCEEPRFLDGVRQMREYGIRSVGLYAQFDGGVSKRGYFAAVAQVLCRLAETVEKELPVSCLNLGGGYGIHDELAGELDSLRAMLERMGRRSLPLRMELGQWVTGASAALVTRVCSVQDGQKKQARLDLSTANLIRHLLFRTRYPVSLLGNHRISDRCAYTLTGSLSDERDRFHGLRCLPPLKAGDYLAVHDTGAYAGDARYGGRLACAAYLYRTDGSFVLIRRAERPADVLRQFEGLD